MFQRSLDEFQGSLDMFQESLWSFQEISSELIILLRDIILLTCVNTVSSSGLSDV